MGPGIRAGRLGDAATAAGPTGAFPQIYDLYCYGSNMRIQSLGRATPRDRAAPGRVTPAAGRPGRGSSVPTRVLRPWPDPRR